MLKSHFFLKFVQLQLSNNLRQYFNRKRTIISLVALSGLMSSCNNPAPSKPILEPKDPYTITFVTLNSPTTYYYNGEKEIAGIEHDLAILFVKSLGAAYQAKFLVVNNISQVLPALQNGQADIAASDLSITATR